MTVDRGVTVATSGCAGEDVGLMPGVTAAIGEGEGVMPGVAVGEGLGVLVAGATGRSPLEGGVATERRTGTSAVGRISGIAVA